MKERFERYKSDAPTAYDRLLHEFSKWMVCCEMSGMILPFSMYAGREALHVLLAEVYATGTEEDPKKNAFGGEPIK